MSDRPLVLWINEDPPAALRGALQIVRFHVARSTVDKALDRLGQSRTVLIRLQNTATGGVELKKAVTTLWRPVLDSGASIGILYEGADGGRLAGEILATMTGSAVPTMVTLLKGNDVHAIATFCCDSDPGRPRNEKLAVTGDVPDASDVALLKRAFSDFSSIAVTVAPGGRSTETRVWRIYAQHEDQGNPVPFIAKAGPRKAIELEIENIVRNVIEYIPFPHRPPLLRDRYVRGEKDALLVTAFVDRARRLDEYLRTDAAPLAMAALFDGPLRLWRRNTRPETFSPDVYRTHGVIPRRDHADRFAPAYEAARIRDTSVAAPDALLATFYALPALPVQACMSHGDLHPRNIFVRKNGIDVVVIDFQSTRYVRPMSADLASMDVALTLDLDDGDGHIDDDEIIRLYTPPLTPVGQTSANGRLEALRYVRLHAASETRSAEYDRSIAAYLLRVARFCDPTTAIDQRRIHGLAYLLAARLVDHLTS